MRPLPLPEEKSSGLTPINLPRKKAASSHSVYPGSPRRSGSNTLSGAAAISPPGLAEPVIVPSLPLDQRQTTHLNVPGGAISDIRGRQLPAAR